MSYSLYDWNQSLQQRNEYVEDRLKDGSPVVAVSYDDGILMLSLRPGQQRKVYEVYDRLMLGALGKQSDIESLRIAAIDTAHREGFERSPDDVSIQRLVGFALSPAIKRVYNDQSAIPLTLRIVFAEMNRTPDEDHFFVMGYDGEFAPHNRHAVVAGTPYAEEQAEAVLAEAAPKTLDEALRAALNAWGTARARLSPKSAEDDEEFDPLREGGENGDGGDAPPVSDDPAVALREALKDGAKVEAGILSRNTTRESKFRLLDEKELAPVLEAYQ
jgi:20S proteasome, alpha and beta subunits